MGLWIFKTTVDAQEMFCKQFTVWQFAKVRTHKNFISEYLAF